jgi:RND superfamily putative drug exporter
MGRIETLRAALARRPVAVVVVWFMVAAAVCWSAPSLTRLAAEGQSRLLGPESESRRAAELVRQAWPDQAYESTAVLGLHRPAGLTDADRHLMAAVARQFAAADRPPEILRVLGPESPPEIAERLVSRDGTLGLVVVPLDSAHVSPASHEALEWLQKQARVCLSSLPVEPGIELLWTGDAVIGRDYMARVQNSLDRAAVATLLLLLVVLLVVYRSVLLALVPLTTIGTSVLVSRGLLAWLCLAGWEISPLVELFLVAVLFGTGTDFCLFLSWRFAEHFNPRNPGGVMRLALSRSFTPLVTSAGTTIIALLLMGTTKFKLFSTTGPSVALGLAVSLLATLTLAPALLLLLARTRPRSFQGFIAPSSGFWDKLGKAVMANPMRSWCLTLVLMAPLAILGLQTNFVMDLLAELPEQTESSRNLNLVASKFVPGMIAPLTVVLESDKDLRQSEGLALIDDVSRFLARQRAVHEVRSATQPLGSSKPLERARLASRLTEVQEGFRELTEGAELLRKGLTEGAAKLRAALWLERQTGLSLTAGSALPGPSASPRPTGEAAPIFGRSRADALTAGLKSASSALLGFPAPAAWDLAGLVQTLEPSGVRSGTESPAGAATQLDPVSAKGAAVRSPAPSGNVAESPGERLLAELTRAAEGADQIADGARRAHREVAAILADPVGQRALSRLLITPENVRENPDLQKSFAVYITPDGRRARIEVTMGDRLFSHSAMNQVELLRQRLNDFLSEDDGFRVKASITGAIAESADIRSLTHADQVRSWFIVPIGVFLVLLVALRDPWACANLVGTMILTYAFALGATHVVFVSILGAEGLDWKVPYFVFVLLVAVGVDYNVFLMTRLREESAKHGLRQGIVRSISQTGRLISSAAAITACSFAAFLFSPLSSLRQLGFALGVGIVVDALLVRPLLVPCGHWLLRRSREVLGSQETLAERRFQFARTPD